VTHGFHPHSVLVDPSHTVFLPFTLPSVNPSNLSPLKSLSPPLPDPPAPSLDGKRVRKWNVRSQIYGEAWASGDVIGSCIDLDRGEISFYRNGVSLGVAFRNVRTMQVSEMG